MFPSISIVTPSYNQANFLEETILSVLDQNYPNLEYIIIDGGSNDNSVEIIKKYEKYLSYWISEPDNGLYHALQKGFERSTGELMAWINSDDKYHPNSFYTVVDIFSSFREVNWLTGCMTSFDEQGRTVAVTKSKKWSKFDYYTFNYKWIQQESTFWRRNLWVKAGSRINTSLKLAGDLELWLRFFRFERLYNANILIGGFRLRSSNQLSLNFMDEYEEEANALIRKEIANIDISKLLNKYKHVNRVFNHLPELKVFNRYKIKYKNKIFNYAPTIKFNRYLQKFEMD